MKSAIVTALTAFALGASVLSVQADGVTTGEAAPDFTLTDSNGQNHHLSDFKGKNVVLEWTNEKCPFVVKHYKSGNMQSLQKTYTDKGVVWLAICSSAPGKQGHKSGADWNKQLEADNAHPTALLIDEDGTVGRMYGAKTTPHMYVINADGILVYQGAIDSNNSWKPEDIADADNYVADALDAIMAGKDIAVSESKPYGCGVKY